MDVGVDATGRKDQPLARDSLCSGSDDDVHAGLDVGVSRAPNARDAAVLDPDVGLHDAPVVQNQCVGDDHIHGKRRNVRALAHAVADRLAPAELHFLAVDPAVLLDLDPEFGVGQAHAIAHGGAVHFGVGGAVDSGHQRPSNGPMTCCRKPRTTRSPA